LRARTELSQDAPTRVLALLESNWVTGPAKNLIGFCRWAHSPEGSAARLRISIATYSREPYDEGSNAFVQAARAAGIDTHIIRERRRFDRGVYPRLAEIVADVAPQIVQTHNVKSHFVFKSSGLQKGKIWLAFQHGYQDTDLKLHLYNQLDRWSLRSADRVISVCEAFTRRLVAYGVRRERIRVLHNSVTPPVPVPAEGAVNALRHVLGIETGDAIILTIGRMSGEKGHADLLEALHLLPANVPPWRALLIGDGPERERLVSLATRLGIADRVVFAGFRSDVQTFYSVATVLALPSHSEGSSNVILEAMAARVPIAATAVGGNPEILTDEETALLSRGRDPEGLARSLTRLLTDSMLVARLTAAAHSRAMSRFSPEQYRQTLLEIYSGVRRAD
jgi:glycosyltransferase involved in cell wall biosynthesis